MNMNLCQKMDGRQDKNTGRAYIVQANNTKAQYKFEASNSNNVISGKQVFHTSGKDEVIKWAVIQKKKKKNPDRISEVNNLAMSESHNNVSQNDHWKLGDLDLESCVKCWNTDPLAAMFGVCYDVGSGCDNFTQS